MNGTLYVVATPIGNLDDLSPRALKTLADVDLIAAEDTRHTGRLLLHIGCKTPQIAFHEHNEDKLVDRLTKRLVAGESIALVSDAGTPLISDPGYRIVRAAHDAGVPVVPIPGPSAAVAALSVSGIATDRFCFEGFLPVRASRRRQRLEALAGEPRTIVFFEAVHRIEQMLADLADAFGAARPAYVGRELSKRYEQGLNATLGDCVAALRDGSVPAKGEFVVVVEGAPDKPAASFDTDRLLLELAELAPLKQAAATAARITGERRNALYRRLLDLANPDAD